MFLPVWLSFAAVFAFLLQAFQLTIFNYVLPYSYAASYGVLFSVLLLWILARNCVAPQPWHMLAAGLVAGLLALDKVEFGIATVRACCGPLQSGLLGRCPFSSLARDAAALIPGILLFVPVYGWLISQSSAAFLFGDNFGILPSSYFARNFAKAWAESNGLSTSPAVWLGSLATGLSGAALVLAALYAAGRFRGARWTLAMTAVAIACGHTALLAADGIFHRPVPVVLEKIAPFVFFNSGMIWLSVVLLGLAAKRWLETKQWLDTKEPTPGTSVLLLLPVFAIFVGARIFTKFMPMYYAVFFDTLAFLAWLVAIYELARLLRLRLNDSIWKGAAVLLCLGIAALTSERYAVHRRPSQIHFARGDIYTLESTGEAFTKTVDFLNTVTARSERFVVMPEDTAIYYFTGTVAPSRWYVVTPQVLPPGAPTGAYLAELDRSRIEYVVLSNRATPEYGPAVFGVDYQHAIYGWIENNFELTGQIGDYQRDPYPPGWGVQIYKRRHAGERHD